MNIPSFIAHSIRSSGPSLARYLAGFTEDNRCLQAPNLPNHAAWTLGHLSLTMHRAAETIAARTIELKWSPEPYAFASTPTPNPADYPSLSELRARFDAALENLALIIESTSDADLAREVTWGGGRLTMSARDLALRMLFHNGMHAGQLADLRRAHNFPSVFR